MSMMTSHNLQCPHCGNEQETTVWDSINVTLDPDLKKELFAVAINHFECRKCGEKEFTDMLLLYHDMTQKFYVQYYPSGFVSSSQFPRQRLNPSNNGWPG